MIKWKGTPFNAESSYMYNTAVMFCIGNYNARMAAILNFSGLVRKAGFVRVPGYRIPGYCCIVEHGIHCLEAFQTGSPSHVQACYRVVAISYQCDYWGLMIA
eukprot:scpid110601/ scgid8829/ 